MILKNMPSEDMRIYPDTFNSQHTRLKRCPRAYRMYGADQQLTYPMEHELDAPYKLIVQYQMESGYLSAFDFHNPDANVFRDSTVNLITETLETGLPCYVEETGPEQAETRKEELATTTLYWIDLRRSINVRMPARYRGTTKSFIRYHSDTQKDAGRENIPYMTEGDTTYLTTEKDGEATNVYYWIPGMWRVYHDSKFVGFPYCGQIPQSWPDPNVQRRFQAVSPDLWKPFIREGFTRPESNVSMGDGYFDYIQGNLGLAHWPGGGSYYFTRYLSRYFEGWHYSRYFGGSRVYDPYATHITGLSILENGNPSFGSVAEWEAEIRARDY